MNMETEQVHNKWKRFKFTNNNGMSVHILNYGGVITKITVPDKNGNLENVVLGYKNYQDYESDSNFFGAIIGQVAGRIQNAAFPLAGNEYSLEKNDGNNHLHGGSNGFHQVIWDAETFQSDDGIGVVLSHQSKDDEDGYPGNIEIKVTYTLTNDNQLMIDYWATTDKTTALTLTNHSYFNLSGNLKDTIHQHNVTVDSHEFVELHSDLTPTGNIVDVANTPFDFREGRKLNDGMISKFGQNQTAGNGYDHYFIFDHKQQENVIVKDESSGRVLSIKTNQPGMVLYTSNNLEKGLELTEGPSRKYLGVCFETQGSPASLHHEGFPNIILKGNEIYKKKTIFSFGTE